MAVKIFFRISRAFLARDLRAASTYRLAFAKQGFDALVTVLIFFFLAKLVSAQTEGTMLAEYENNYFAFVVLGLGMASFVALSLGSMANWIRQEQYLGTMDALCAAPVDWETLAVAAALARYAGAVIQLILYLAIGLLLGLDLLPHGLPAALLVFLLSVGIFFGLGMLAAALRIAFKQGAGSLRMAAGSAGNLLGGVYFPVPLLPAGLSFLSYLLPITYALRGLRRTLLGGAGFGAVLPELIVLTFFLFLSLMMGRTALRWAFRRARHDGTLGQI